MVFRKATGADIKKVSDIYEEIHKIEEAERTGIGWIRGVYPTYDTAKCAFDREDLFVCEDNGEVIGAAIINKVQVDTYKYGHWMHEAKDEEVMVLHTLVISPTHGKKGYGKSFVAFYEEYALKNNCRYLRMDTNANNTRARAMYKKLGYSEIGIVDCTFNGIEGVGLVLLEKKL